MQVGQRSHVARARCWHDLVWGHVRSSNDDDYGAALPSTLGSEEFRGIVVAVVIVLLAFQALIGIFWYIESNRRRSKLEQQSDKPAGKPGWRETGWDLLGVLLWMAQAALLVATASLAIHYVVYVADPDIFGNLGRMGRAAGTAVFGVFAAVFAYQAWRASERATAAAERATKAEEKAATLAESALNRL